MSKGLGAALLAAIVTTSAVATIVDEHDTKKVGGLELVAQRCQACHDLSVTTGHRASRAGWREVVQRMVQNGAQLSKSESEEVVDYLSEFHGSEP